MSPWECLSASLLCQGIITRLWAARDGRIHIAEPFPGSTHPRYTIVVRTFTFDATNSSYTTYDLTQSVNVATTTYSNPVVTASVDDTAFPSYTYLAGTSGSSSPPTRTSVLLPNSVAGYSALTATMSAGVATFNGLALYKPSVGSINIS